MKYGTQALFLILGFGAALGLGSCAGKLDAQAVQPTPSEMLPSPSRTLPRRIR